MIRIIVLTLLIAICLAQKIKFPLNEDLPNGGKIWVLLVAGSKGYFNYRHQADVCHAYQVVHSHGIPDENIVVMMYDDIAYSPQNKIPGKIYNKPQGPDVYENVPKDYVGDENNPENFLRVLEGDEELMKEGKKVIDSGPNDHVFVFFADHGAPGLLAFPDSILKSRDFIKTLYKKHKNNGYAKMVFYVEACESGSMFNGILPDDINVFATTAANSTQSSYACYYDSDLDTFLGDYYSVNWLEDSDAENLNKETLKEQYEIVKDETKKSQVCEFGDLSIAQMKVSSFQGAKKSSSVNLTLNDSKLKHFDLVPSGDVEKVILERRMSKSNNEKEFNQFQMEYNEYMNIRKKIDKVIRTIVNSVTSDESESEKILDKTPEITQENCYFDAVDSFHKLCFNLGQYDYALRVIYALANLCESHYHKDLIIYYIEETCYTRPEIEIIV